MRVTLTPELEDFSVIVIGGAEYQIYGGDAMTPARAKEALNAARALRRRDERIERDRAHEMAVRAAIDGLMGI